MTSPARAAATARDDPAPPTPEADAAPAPSRAPDAADAPALVADAAPAGAPVAGAASLPPSPPARGDATVPAPGEAASLPHVARARRPRGPDHGVRPHLVPTLDAAARAQARAEVQAAREARGERVEAGAATPVPGAAGAAAPAAGAADAAAQAPMWALSTPSLRTRFESEQMLVALRDVAGADGRAGARHFDVLPVGDDWRAVAWPYAERSDAERVRLALHERGVRVEVVRF